MGEKPMERRTDGNRVGGGEARRKIGAKEEKG
jgi:hypothetical protein